MNLVISEISTKYQTSMQEEIHLSTKIDDPSKSIKDPIVCREKEKELRKKLFCNYSFSGCSKDVLDIAIQRCEGNPMLTM